MWLFAFFDLPVKTAHDRKEANRFRKVLESMGFMRLQYSVYALHHASEERAVRSKRAIWAELPDKGEVRLLMVTDRQFGKMEVYQQEKQVKVEQPPEQLLLL